MAKDTKKPRASARKPQTVRERTKSTGVSKGKRIRQTAGRASKPLKKFHGLSKREHHLIPLPDNKVGKVLNKRVRFVPKFIREAWHELRLVTWPNARETWRLTMAVFIFAIIFAGIVGLLDYVLGEIFREVVIKR